jgi:uncharacterized protein (DUF2336 family)
MLGRDPPSGLEQTGKPVNSRTSLIVELEDALASGSSEKRAEVLARVTDLFVYGAESLDEAQVDLFDDVYARLIKEIETNTLAELGRRLAMIDNAPPKLIRQLAEHEEIAVAWPVLAQAERLDEANLVDIAKEKSQAHLLAISVRDSLSEPVTDVLVDRGYSIVVHSVAANAGARFSENGFATLVKHAQDDEDLAAKVIERSDVPPQMFSRLLIQATDVVRQRLLERAKPETRELIREVLDKVAGEIAADTSAPPDLAGALRRAATRYPGGKPGEADLKDAAIGGNYEDMVAALSLVASVPADTIDRLMHGGGVGPVLILCKAAGFEWATARAVIEAGSRARRG